MDSTAAYMNQASAEGVLDLVTEQQIHLENERNIPEIAPHTCSICEPLVFDLTTFTPGCEPFHFNLKDRDGQLITLTLAHIINGVFEGCSFFRMLISRLLPQAAGIAEEITERLSATDLDTLLRERCPGRHAEDVIYWYCGGWRKHFRCVEVYCGSLFPRGLLLERLDLTERSLKTLPLGNTHQDRKDVPQLGKVFSPLAIPPNLVPSSPLAVHRVRRWLEDCRSNHALCRKWRLHHAPRRLLEIIALGRKVRLVQDSGISRYAALTYCWGGDQPYKTTRANVSSYSMSVGVGSLPATIQDALHVTESVGLRHLWVDAMCIVQDDVKDLQQELSQMHRIYRGAAFTIVAADAKSSSEGFLRPRVDWRPSLLRCSLTGREQFEVSVCRNEIFDECDAIIFMRAWVLQELHLSTSALVYHKRTMVFSCLERRCDDRGREGEDVDADWALSPGCRDLARKSHPYAWGYLVEQYAGLEMSQWTDKLPALGALAEEYSQRFDVTHYYAGLWAEDLLWQLLWVTSDDWPPRGRPQGFVAPTWSWASLIGGKIEPPHETPENHEFTAEIRNVNRTLLSDSNPYGRVTSARLTLRTRVRPCVLHVPLKIDESAPHHWYADIRNERDLIQGRTMWAAQIGARQSYIDCLLLEEVVESSTAIPQYRRVGLICYDTTSFEYVATSEKVLDIV